MEEIDIYRTANILMQQSGDKALLEAIARAEHFAALNDARGEALWKKVIDAIAWMQAPGYLNKSTGH